MRYVKLELKGFRRIALAGIHTFVIEPHSSTQIILGTNGCGKSSIMKQLSPDPAKKDDFSKDGYKKIWIEHNGVIYSILTEFEHGTRCTFVNETTGEIINNKGTAKVQEQLNRQVLGYNPEIHDILTGQERFTDMSPSRRREWFTMMSDVDYTFAIKLFNKAKENARDVSGALKQAKKRLNEEYSLIITEEERLRINDNIKEIENRIEALRAINVLPVNRDTRSLKEQLSQLMIDIEKSVKIITRARNFMMTNKVSADASGELESEIAKYNSLIGGVDARSSTLIEEYDRLKSKSDLVRNNTNKNVEILLSNKDKINEEINTIKAGLDPKFDYSNASMKAMSLRACFDSLMNVFENIEIRPTKKDISLQSLIGERNDINTKLAAADARLEMLRNKKTDLLQHSHEKNTECPECGHRWIPGYNEKELKDTEEILEKGISFKAKAEEKIAELNRVIEIETDYDNHLRNYISIMEHNTELFSLREYIYNNKLLEENPRSIINVMTTYQRGLDKSIRAETLANELVQINRDIDNSKATDGINVHELDVRMEEITKELGVLTEQKRLHIDQLEISKRKLAALNAYMNHMTTVADLRDKMSERELNLAQVIVSDNITNIIREEQTHLASLINRSKDIESRMTVIKEIESNIERLTIDEKLYNEIVVSLSPTNGLIAEGLFGFIKLVVKQMNAILKDMWNYPLVITLPTFEDGANELNYKFPVAVGENMEMTKDVADASDGQIEVFNLAFKLVAMRYLGLSKYPMKLDEFGKGFDVEHRNQATRFIKAFMESGECEQIFIVSHYVESYGALPNSEVCVVYDKNIIIPKDEFNSHVLINGIRNMYNGQ